MYIPLNSESLNLNQSRFNPSVLKNEKNTTFYFWQRSLIERAFSTLKFKLPKEWESAFNYFLYVLFINGFMVVTDKFVEFGTIFQECTLSGHNVYYLPTNAIVTNPAFNSITLTLGKDGALIQLTPDYQGIMDIVNYHSEKLALIDSAIDVTLANTKLWNFLAGNNASATKVLEKALDKVNSGQPAVITDMSLAKKNLKPDEDPFTNIEIIKNVKDNYIVTNLLEDKQRLLNSFDREIGIPVPTDKKERLIQIEAEQNRIDGMSRSQIWLLSLKTTMKEVNDMYDLGLDVELRYSQERGINDDENNPNRNV